MGIDQENFSVLERASSKELRNKYDHLKGLSIPNSTDGRYVIHLLIGDLMLIEIRTGKSAKGNPGEPIGDETLFGWAVHGEKGESDHNYFARTTSDEYEGLYQLDVLGVEDRKEFDQDEVKKEFLENVSRKQTSRYVVKIPWIEDRIPQQTNEAQS